MIDNNATNFGGSILIFGAGSIGGVLGVLLSHQGYHVTFFRRSVPKYQASIQLIGVETKAASVSIHSPSSSPSLKLKADLIFLTVQAQQVAQAMQDLLAHVEITTRTIFVSLQNGLTAPSLIEASLKPKLGKPPILIQGVLWWSATQITDDVVLYHNKAITTLGIPACSTATDSDLLTVYNLLASVLPVASTNDILTETRKKLILNVVSPVLALLKLPYPSGLRNTTARNLIHLMFDEVLAIGEEKGWNLDDDRLFSFHKILAGIDPPPPLPSYKIDGAFQSLDIVHKVSTQISAEKHGGRTSNALELLSFFIENGAVVCQEVLEEIYQLSPHYQALSESRLEAIISRNSEKSCNFANV